MDDIFESSPNLEQTHLKEGFDEGLIAGEEEARQVGFEVGEELGFYRGRFGVWSSAARTDPTRPDPILRFRKPEDEKIQEIMDGLRLRFIAVCASTGLKLDYNGLSQIFFQVYRHLSSRSRLGCCKVYISEGRNRRALESIERAAKRIPEARVVNKFEDESYNRVGYTVVSELSRDPPPMKAAVFSMVKAALGSVDLESHIGSHPRLGVVDHICVHPLLSASLDQAASVTRSLAADIGHCLQVPTFLYGAASLEGKTLDAVRRELGYFKPNSSGNQWSGGPKPGALALKPDEGPTRATPTKGVVVVGSTRWVDNYNIPVFSADLSAVRRISRRVSERGGGLSSVQAMALAQGEDAAEVACNLLEPSRVGGDRVQIEVERLAKEEGLTVGQGYFTDLSQEKIVESYYKLL